MVGPYASRHGRSVALRRILARSVRLLRRVSAFSARGEPPSGSFRLIPAPLSGAEEAEALARFYFYLGDVADELELPSSRLSATLDPSSVPHLDPSLVRLPAQLTSASVGPCHVLVHRATVRGIANAARSRRPFSVVDPRFHFIDDLHAYLGLRQSLQGEPANNSTAVNNLFRLAGDTALVAGTGPSARTLLDQVVDQDVRIVCNSAIRDDKLMAHVRPNIVAFSDHVFHFGPSRYAAEFRMDVRRVAEQSECIFLVPDWGHGLLMRFLPDLEERIVAFHLDGTAESFKSITGDSLSVKITGNVLTQYMLPTAFGLANIVSIAGCDGRSSGETYFWSHGKTVQYSDELMRSVFESHPAFFRDEDYRDYYDTHCQNLERLLEMAEQAGKSALSLTFSHIPALKARSS